MNLLNKLITKTAIYKHLNDLYEQTLRDCEELQYKVKENNITIDFYKKSYESTENAYYNLNTQFDKLNINVKETNKYYTKLLKKIRAHVNKLDKKDENVKAIKQLIKEVL